MCSPKEGLSRDKWLSRLQELSKPYHDYGSFLPEQLGLLEEIYEKLRKSKRPVWVFSAPPASGKTHVMCLLARTLAEAHYSTAIVVPNNYLKEEFEEGRLEVNGDLPKVDLLSLSGYLRTDKPYDFVLVDEAHNLKSFLELDINIVKSLDMTERDEPYGVLSSRYLPSEKEFAAQQLSFSSTTDILNMLKRIPKFKRQLVSVLREPTSWLCFIYIWKNLNQCSLKFVHASGLCKLKLPKKHLLLFTATPLSDEELDFYCGIPSDAIERALDVKPASAGTEKQRVCMFIKEKFSFENKIAFVKELVRESNARTLVLFNNVANCQKAFEILSNDISNIFVIPSYARDRPAILKSFLGVDCGVLLTSSSVFWEGITIKKLRLLIIVDPPFPRPRLIELMKRRATDGRMDMSRRLLQGVGRVGRKRGEFGVVITLFDPSIANKEPVRREFRKMQAKKCSGMLHRLIEQPG